jgi:hypothetical protein
MFQKQNFALLPVALKALLLLYALSGPAWGGERGSSVEMVITASVLGLGLAFGIFILLRLRAEPAEDQEDKKRRRSIEEGLGLGGAAKR